ncbi:hypothetical protein GN244_ATG02102 [Phytophthora infestans]|uniref:Uncharacterized protein n=1 Tax=Phytophthora infestans TaxID=4787 RepID=A0A833W7K2_PHYIN|nr:hypothetical protein GN244_ATG02102 [Phytophthora infestans]
MLNRTTCAKVEEFYWSELTCPGCGFSAHSPIFGAVEELAPWTRTRRFITTTRAIYSRLGSASQKYARSRLTTSYTPSTISSYFGNGARHLRGGEE